MVSTAGCSPIHLNKQGAGGYMESTAGCSPVHLNHQSCLMMSEARCSPVHLNHHRLGEGRLMMMSQARCSLLEPFCYILCRHLFEPVVDSAFKCLSRHNDNSRVQSCNGTNNPIISRTLVYTFRFFDRLYYLSKAREILVGRRLIKDAFLLPQTELRDGRSY
jgi:hypothetical protein